MFGHRFENFLFVQNDTAQAKGSIYFTLSVVFTFVSDGCFLTV